VSYLFSVTGHDASSRPAWPADDAQERRLLSALSDAMRPALQEACAIAGAGWDRHADVSKEIAAFLTLYRSRPLADNEHGSGLNDTLWLWLLLRHLKPVLFVESGTFKGHSAWIARRACPDARIVTHDVELQPSGRLRARNADYRLHDWSESHDLERPAVDGLGLCFFDDHISHYRRLMEAARHGFRYLLFDDNFPAWQLHATGAPPVPTLDMLRDDEGDLDPLVRWRRRGKLYAFDWKKCMQEREESRTVIERVLKLPELSPLTRHPPGSGMTFVVLKPDVATELQK